MSQPLRRLTVAEQQLVLGASEVVGFHVRSLVRVCPSASAYEEDLRQAGYLGAMAALETWREGAGASFTTYAGPSIRWAVLYAWRTTGEKLGRKHGPTALVPLQEAFELAGPAEDLDVHLDAARLRASLPERLAAHLGRGLHEQTRAKVVRAWVMRMQGRTLKAIGEELGVNTARAHVFVAHAEEALQRWASSMNTEGRAA